MIYAVICFNIDGQIRFKREYKPTNLDLVKKCYTGKYLFIKYLDNYNVVYHRFGNLVVCMCVDKNENLLNIGSFINRIMNVFDLLFTDLCELNLVYSLNLVYKVLDRFILDGKMLEVDPIKIAKEFKK
ncbi:adaptin small subunit [Tubulinosema ratisbonensis]|uniref:Adaptin small subunit n=1 Tax=Tubulinosema ratisbonensis TaxID=291195 RepID=A0A437ANV6_9MICR|nr:adaptin small subunit [Tubulinosema ratisbonensis]